MARLPTAADLGITSPFSERRIASYDATGYAKGAAALAAGMADVGRGLQSAGSDVAAVANEQQKQEDRLQAARARSTMAVETIAARKDTSNEIPSAELPERYRTRLLTKRNGLQEGFVTPEQGAAFAMASDADIAKAVAEVQAETQQRSIDAMLGDWKTRGDGAIMQAVASPDEQARIRVIDSFNGELVEFAQAYPAIQPQVRELQQKFVRDYALAWGMERVQTDPAGVLRDVQLVSGPTVAAQEQPVPVAETSGGEGGGESAGTEPQARGNEPATAEPGGVSGAKAAGGGNLYEFLSKEQQDFLADHAERNITRREVLRASERSAELQQQFQAAAQSVPGARLPDRSVIETDPVLMANPVLHAELLRRYDEAEAEVVKTRADIEDFMNPLKRYSRFDPRDQDGAERMFRWLGGTLNMVQPVVDRTGMVPTSVLNSVRGLLSSQDPKEVQAALNVLANLLTNNDQIFQGVEGGKELASAAEWYRREVLVKNQKAAEVTQRYMVDRASQKDLSKTEALDPRVEKLTATDLADAFGKWWPWILHGSAAEAIGLMRNPAVGFTGRQGEELLAQFKSLTNDYVKNSVHGDLDIAKTLAAKTLGITWGVSNVNGSYGIGGGGVLMMYPPEHAPAVQNLKDAPGRIAQAAQAAIKKLTGEDVERSSLVFEPIPGRTAQAYFSGERVPYRLSWQAKNGEMRTILEFSFDHFQAQKEDTAEREKEFYKYKARTDMDEIALRRTPPRLLTPELRREREKSFERTGDIEKPADRKDKAAPASDDEQRPGTNLLAPIDRPKDFVVTPGSAELPRAPDRPGFMTAAGASLRTHSSIFAAAAAEGLSGVRTPGFNAWKQIVGTPYERYSDRFNDIHNPGDLEKRKRQIVREVDDRRINAATPAYLRWPMNFAASFADWPSAVPGGWLAKSGNVFVKGARIGAIRGAMQEVGLHNIESTRTFDESMNNILRHSLGKGMFDAGAPFAKRALKPIIDPIKRRLGLEP